jgi:peptidyl-prolyl cis-trans isomerase C
MKRVPRHIPIIIALVAVTTGLFAQQAPAPASDINPPVLRVNGETIYAAEISMVMANIDGQLKAQGREVPEQDQLVQMATQRVVEQKLLAQEARRQGYKVDDLKVAEMAQVVEQQAGGREALDASLASKGSNYDQLMTTIKEIDLVRTLMAKQISPTVEVSEEEIAEYYTANPEMFETPAQVHARHIIFAAGETADADTIISARENAVKARDRALAGEDFVELAKELSQGPSAADGGDLGFFSYGQMVPPFAEAAFALEPGEISDVVRTGFGFHIIKVEEKKEAVTPSLDEVRPRIQLLLTQQKSGEKVQELILTLVESAQVEPLVEPEANANPPAAPAQPE